jgi:hypothetical protein
VSPDFGRLTRDPAEIEAATGIPLGALVAVRRDASGVVEHPASCSWFQVMKVALRLVKSFSGPGVEVRQAGAAAGVKDVTPPAGCRSAAGSRLLDQVP